MDNGSWIKDKIVMITGANSGIGKATALELNRFGAKVIMMCRNEKRAQKAKEEIIEDTGNSDIEIIICDLADLDSIRNAAAEFKKKYDKLHVLINNAGLISFKKQFTANGFERTWGTNHIGHFLLTMLLLDVIKKNSPARIINLSSHGHNFASKEPLEDMYYENKKYKHIKAYGDSKLMNIWFTKELARRLEGTGVTVNAVHPGGIRTGFGKRGNPWWYQLGYYIATPVLKSPAKGARTSIHLASSSEVADITGKYWAKCKEKKSSKQSLEEESQKKLWELSEKLTDLN
jgi:NAD(P)-dependent dehydrogenase (short-subunit alcohol dehydrogenase family)